MEIDLVVVVVFVGVYLGMILGRLPGLALDRTGLALLGAIILLVFKRVTLEQAIESVDIPTISLLFGLMIVSAQFRLGGLYTAITRRIANVNAAPDVILALVIAVTAILSALLANDIVCLAVTPILIEGCTRRSLNPIPFLLALACAANIGSAATLIGNPQNMLIGQVMKLDFVTYLVFAALPVVLGLAAVWFIIRTIYKSKISLSLKIPEIEAPQYNTWQNCKGLMVLVVLVAAFLTTDWQRDVLALGAAGWLLASRRMASRDFMHLVDWELLVLFIGLFIVNGAVVDSGLFASSLDYLSSIGFNLESPAWLFISVAVLSNIVSNVPAVMLLLPAATNDFGAEILALVSTFAGNLFIVGSIANIIVADQAAKLNLKIDWREHARTGIPVTVVTLVITAIWITLKIH